MSDEYIKLAEDLQQRRGRPYEVITLDLTTARDKEPLAISGNFIAVDQSSSAGANIDIAFNDKDGNTVRFDNTIRVDTMFMRLYLTHAAQSGVTIKLIVGVKEFFGFFLTSGGGSVDALGDIGDVDLTGISTDDFIKWDGTNWVPISSSTVVAALNDITNVTITANSAGEILKWNGTAWINNTLAEAGIAAATHTHVEADITDLQSYLLNITGEPLSDLSDVTITGIASGEILKWNGSAWINNTLAEAGIAAATHTHVEADITDLQSYLLNIVEDTTPQLGGDLDCQANAVTFEQGAVTGTGAQTIDWGTGNKQQFTFGAGNATLSFTDPAEACSLILKVVQDATGSRTMTWPAAVKWPGGTAPTLSTGANAVDVIAFYHDGTNYYGSTSLNFS